jgi:multiple sugar transport system substrate-binding protein
MQRVRVLLDVRFAYGVWALVATLILAACAAIQPAGSAPGANGTPIPLRIAVSHTPQSLASFQEALAKIEATHPEWTITVEQVPQSSEIEKINTMLAAGTLPDVVNVQGLTAQRWIRQNAFLDLTDRISAADLEDFFPGPLEQFEWNGSLWAIPSTAAPEIVFYNKAMFDAAGLDYPTSDWTRRPPC